MATNQSSFFGAAFDRSNHQRPDNWRDLSTPEYFVFESQFGTVHIRKRHTHPFTYAYVVDAKLYVGYGNVETAQSILSQPLADVPETLFYDEEFTLLVADCAEQTVVVQRDAFGTLALYCGYDANKLVISSDFGTVCTSLKGKLHIDRLGMSESLLSLPSRNNTLFKEVTVLYDRGRLIWDHATYRHIEPPDATALQYAQAHRDADPRLFVPFLEETLDRYWHRYGQDTPVACDLSGGYDSSLVVGYLADKQRNIIAGTLIYPELHGWSVEQKLDAFLQRFPIPHSREALNPVTDYPLANMVWSGHWRPVYPNNSLYDIPTARLADNHAAQGATVIFTGVGGDELCQNIDPHASVGQGQKEYERRVRLPLPAYFTPSFRDYYADALRSLATQRKAVPLLAFSAMQQNVGSYEPFFARNLWPVSPLADPRLFSFCQSLRIRYRTQKSILRAYLHARRFPELLYVNATKEHFGDFFNMAVSNHLRQPMIQIFEHSALAQAGLIDKQKVLAAARTAPERSEVWYQLYNLLVVEINLQCLDIRSF